MEEVIMIKEELLKGLTKEQAEKASKCKTAEELLALAKEEEIELTEEQLAQIAGGGCVAPSTKEVICPNCGATVVGTVDGDSREFFYLCVCQDCGNTWKD